MIDLYSWNVNGVRAAQKKGFLEWLLKTQPDILGIQETKSSPEQLDDALLHPDNYHTYWASSVKRKGYSGVALYSKLKPKWIKTEIGISEFDDEGRTIVAEYDHFVFINTYIPNGSRDLSRVPFKLDYCDAFLDYCNALRKRGKSIIFCGDINTSHKEIDIARPKQNQKHTGFLPIERAWIDRVIADGYVDTFRTLHPEQKDAYSWWSYIGNARSRNVGWRLDYFFVSEDLMPHVLDAKIHTEVFGSDHCPVSLTLDF
jgi:exodeoxyribonuclease-3